MKNFLTYIHLLIQCQIIFALLFFNVAISSMFPNAYQYQISKTNLKTRDFNSYNMPLVDAQMAMPLQTKELRELAIYVIGMGLKSIDTDFGSAFSIDRKIKMKVAGDDSAYKLTRDIRAEFVGGDSQTNVDMSLLGKEQMLGCKILIQVPLFNIFKIDFFEDWFLSVRTSLVHLERQLLMQLEGVSPNSILNIKNFFAYGTEQAKIDSKPKTQVGLDNITFSLDGIYQAKNNALEIYYYTGIEIPTNLTYNSPYLFDAIVGNNGNIGFLLGADFHGYFYNKMDKKVGILLEIENHFLLYKTLERTFDLYNQQYVLGVGNVNKNKPWSRYLPAISLENPDEKKVVGDVSTLPVRIHECNNLDVSLGLIFNIINKHDTKFYFATGYNLWMSQPEYTELQDRVYQEEYHNFYNYDIRGLLPYTTSSQTIIKEQLPDDIKLKHFDINDLDCGSVVSDGAYSQAVFVRGSVIGCSGYTLLLGGWYEIGKPKMAPSRIGAWVGGGYEF
jgi:hypothetical protein